MDSTSLYYDPELYSSMKDQRNFEKSIFNKTYKADNEIAFLEGMTIVYKNSIDLFLYVVGSCQENELMLMSVLNCLFDCLSQILRCDRECDCCLSPCALQLARNQFRVNPASCPLTAALPRPLKNVERRSFLENMEGVFLIVDEIIDGGVILESDAQLVLQKINYRVDESSLSEQSVAQPDPKMPEDSNGCVEYQKDRGHGRLLLSFKTLSTTSVQPAGWYPMVDGIQRGGRKTTGKPAGGILLSQALPWRQTTPDKERKITIPAQDQTAGGGGGQPLLPWTHTYKNRVLPGSFCLLL
ncbi:uncharacterized protein LOC133514687 isoform X2 [Syngnathoides biaculeatus]|uniref:uncharacterized protein LOC133514687 isoform X2 n=1 Tax=Syngnathoides biaculeatus TaxID=300417 RepID=UPI002ADDCC54|nr:uncharacterized protein LOC133514687 isoform X2 [Syngnathoides biaculeatus]